MSKGFTLIELIIGLSIIAILTVGLFSVLNPVRQLNKTYDALRLNDLSTITTSLDTYYHDNNCYPVSIPFGQQWSSGETIYSQRLPNDPQEQTNGNYVYFTDTTSSCPQWNVVFSKLSTKANNSLCTLPANCYPQNYNDSWACEVSGTLDCNSLIADALPTSVPTPIASSGNTSTSTGNVLSQNISICHDNGNGIYNQIQVTEDATAGGHDGHSGDIIPPYSYSCTNGTCQYPGKNWGTNGQAIYNNKCSVLQPSSQCTTNGISGVGIVVTSQGSDGSACQEMSVGDMYHSGYCTDSTGYDSRVSGNNSCISSSSLGLSVTRYNCAITNGGTGVRCATSSTPYYPCSTYGVGCMNGECIPNQPTNSYPPDISVSTQDGNTQVMPDTQTYFTVHVNKTCSDVVWSQLFVDGIDFPCTQEDINKVNWLCQGKVIPSLVPSAQNIHVQAFTVDYSGNSGYADMYVHY